MSAATDQMVFDALADTGIPGSREHWPLGDVPPVPRWHYERADGGELIADGSNYAELPRYRVVLVSDGDPELIEEFATRISTLGLRRYRETWDNDEDAVVSTWTFTVHKGANDG